MCHCQAVSPYCGHLAGPIRHLLWWSFEGLQVPCSILTSALRGRKAGVLGQSGWWAELGLELRSWVGASCTSSLLCATGDCKAHFAQSAGSGPCAEHSPGITSFSPHNPRGKEHTSHLFKVAKPRQTESEELAEDPSAHECGFEGLAEPGPQHAAQSLPARVVILCFIIENTQAHGGEVHCRGHSPTRDRTGV